MNREELYSFSGSRIESGKTSQIEGQILILPSPSRIITGTGSISSNSYGMSFGLVGFLASINSWQAMFLWQCYGLEEPPQNEIFNQLSHYLLHNPPGAFYYLGKQIAEQEIAGPWLGYWDGQIDKQGFRELEKILQGEKTIEQIEKEIRQSSPFTKLGNRLMALTIFKPTVELLFTLQGQYHFMKTFPRARLLSPGSG